MYKSVYVLITEEFIWVDLGNPAKLITEEIDYSMEPFSSKSLS